MLSQIRYGVGSVGVTGQDDVCTVCACNNASHYSMIRIMIILSVILQRVCVVGGAGGGLGVTCNP